MPTIAETLRATGMTDEQISALDPKLITVFTGIQTEAERKATEAAAAAQKAEADRQAWEKAKADAELLQRSNTDFYETKIVPGLTSWQEEQVKLQTETANAQALAAFYKAQNDAARNAGFVPTDAPTFVAPANNGTRDGQGRFVPNAPGSTPGSPTFTIEDVRNQIGTSLGTVANIQWKYQSLYGKPMPISPTDLLVQAENNKFKDPATYASQIFKFAEKEEEIRQAAAKAHDDQVASVAAAAKESEWKAKMDAREAEIAAKDKLRAEQGANNPDVRVAVSSKIPELQRQVVAKELPDPLMLNENQRRANTTKMIRDTIAQKDQAAA